MVRLHPGSKASTPLLQPRIRSIHAHKVARFRVLVEGARPPKTPTGTIQHFLAPSNRKPSCVEVAEPRD